MSKLSLPRRQKSGPKPSSRYETLAKELIHHTFEFSESDENFQRSLNFVMSNLLYHHCLDVNSHSVKKSLQGVAFKMVVHGHQHKAERFLALTEKFLLATDCKQAADIKWSVLSLLISIAHHPARDSLSASLTESTAKCFHSEECENATSGDDWLKELMERSCHSPDKDETLSEWSDDDEMIRSSHIVGHDEENKMQRSVNATVIKDECAEDRERRNMLIKNTHLAKSWLVNTLQQNFWGDEERINKDYSFAKTQSQASEVLSITEYAVMRECLWILLCPTTGHIFIRDKNNKMTVKEVSLSTLSKETLAELLLKIAAASDQLWSIDLWLDRLPDITKVQSFGSGTVQAFANGLQTWRHSFNEQITKLENQVLAQDQHCTLIWLINHLEASLQNLSAVYCILDNSILSSSQENLDERSLKLLNALVTYVDRPLRASQKECLQDLLRYTLRHILHLLHSILSDKKISESALNHFGIYSKRTVTTSGKRCQEQNFSVDNTMLENKPGLCFIQSVQTPLLKICELKEIMGHLQTSFEKDQCYDTLELLNVTLEAVSFHPSDTAEFSPAIQEPTTAADSSEECLSFDYPDPFLMKAFEADLNESELRYKDKQRQDGSSKQCDVVSLEHTLSKLLIPIVEQRYHQLGTGLLRVLVDEHKLKFHLGMFKSIILMEAGDIMHDFYALLFCKMDSKENIDDAILTQHIQYCIGFIYPGLADKFSIAIGNGDEEISSNSKLLSRLSVHYENPWPISLVFSEVVMQKYNQLFVFCLILKRAVFILERLHFKEMASYSGWYSSHSESLFHDDSSISQGSFSPYNVQNQQASEESEACLPFPHRLHRLQLLRQWLLYLARILHDHFYTSILISLSQKVDALFQEDRQFESFVQEHEILLNEAIDQCLLREGFLSPVQAALTKLFSTVEIFKDLWRGSPEKITSQQLVRLEEQYVVCHRFMAKFFSTLTQTYFCPHVEGLAQSLKNSCPA